MRICFLGAGSTVFAKNILGDCILTPSLGAFEIALHDIDENRLNESYNIITAVNKFHNGLATISKHLNRKEALKNSDFVINAIQVGGYKPCTVTDFKIPRRYGLKQTIGDTLGIGGIMRGLRTIPVLEAFAKDIEEVCPNAYFLNYSNPMAILTGYLLKHTKVKAVGLCHSVQSCVPSLLKSLKLQDKLEGSTYKICGINHQAWLLEVKDKNGNDLYPIIKQKSLDINYKKHISSLSWDIVRHEVMHTFGYYVTESSEHSSEYMPYFIKRKYPMQILEYHIPINEYPRRCVNQIRNWQKTKKTLLNSDKLEHKKTEEFGSGIIEGLFTGKPFNFHGNVLNTDLLITNLPKEAIVEVPIIADKNGLTPIAQGELPQVLASLNLTNINPQLLTIQASQTNKMTDIYHAALLDPHTSAELNIKDIKNMCNDLYKEHKNNGYLPTYN